MNRKKVKLLLLLFFSIFFVIVVSSVVFAVCTVTTEDVGVDCSTCPGQDFCIECCNVVCGGTPITCVWYEKQCSSVADANCQTCGCDTGGGGNSFEFSTTECVAYNHPVDSESCIEDITQLFKDKLDKNGVTDLTKVTSIKLLEVASDDMGAVYANHKLVVVDRKDHNCGRTIYAVSRNDELIGDQLDSSFDNSDTIEVHALNMCPSSARGITTKWRVTYSSAPTYTCEDSDDGEKPYTAGRAYLIESDGTIVARSEKKDICNAQTGELKEAYCNGNNPDYYAERECPLGCENVNIGGVTIGRCIKCKDNDNRKIKTTASTVDYVTFVSDTIWGEKKTAYDICGTLQNPKNCLNVLEQYCDNSGDVQNESMDCGQYGCMDGACIELQPAIDNQDCSPYTAKKCASLTSIYRCHHFDSAYQKCEKCFDTNGNLIDKDGNRNDNLACWQNYHCWENTSNNDFPACTPPLYQMMWGAHVATATKPANADPKSRSYECREDTPYCYGSDCKECDYNEAGCLKPLCNGKWNSQGGCCDTNFYDDYTGNILQPPVTKIPDCNRTTNNYICDAMDYSEMDLNYFKTGKPLLTNKIKDKLIEGGKWLDASTDFIKDVRCNDKSYLYNKPKNEWKIATAELACKQESIVTINKHDFIVKFIEESSTPTWAECAADIAYNKQETGGKNFKNAEWFDCTTAAGEYVVWVCALDAEGNSGWYKELDWANKEACESIDQFKWIGPSPYITNGPMFCCGDDGTADCRKSFEDVICDAPAEIAEGDYFPDYESTDYIPPERYEAVDETAGTTDLVKYLKCSNSEWLYYPETRTWIESNGELTEELPIIIPIAGHDFLDAKIEETELTPIEELLGTRDQLQSYWAECHGENSAYNLEETGGKNFVTGESVKNHDVIYFCTSKGVWETELENADEITCESALDPEGNPLNFKWIGSDEENGFCCGFHGINDCHKTYLDYTLGICDAVNLLEEEEEKTTDLKGNLIDYYSPVDHYAVQDNIYDIVKYLRCSSSEWLYDGSTWTESFGELNEEGEAKIKTINRHDFLDAKVMEEEEEEQPQDIIVEIPGAKLESYWAECADEESPYNTYEGVGEGGLNYYIGQKVNHSNIIYYCTSEGKWIEDLDEADEETCTSAGFYWIPPGEEEGRCCGDQGIWDIFSVPYEDGDACFMGIPFPECYTEIIDTEEELEVLPLQGGVTSEDGVLFFCPGEDNYCKIKCDMYFCSYATRTWEYSYYPLRNFSSTWPGTLPEGRIPTECCGKTQCWNGIMCVNDQSYDSTSLPYEDYRCINGTWKKSEIKKTWDYLEQGYCPEIEQCLVNPYAINNDYENMQFLDIYYPLGNDIQCINSGQFIGDHYCEGGKWTTRTKLLALQLLDFVKKQRIDDYVLFCDNYYNTLNNYDYEVITEFGSLNKAYDYIMEESYNCEVLNTYVPCVNKFCVLKYKSGDKYEVALATSLNNQINQQDGYSVLELFKKQTNYCNSAMQQDGQFHSCDPSHDTWFNKQFNSVIYDKNSIQLAELNFVEKFLEFIKNPFLKIFNTIIKTIKPRYPGGSVYDYNFILNTTKFDKIYLSNKETKSVRGIMETIDDKSFLSLTYQGFGADICKSIETYHKATPSLGYISCDSKDNTYYIETQDYRRAGIWRDLTSKIRI